MKVFMALRKKEDFEEGMIVNRKCSLPSILIIALRDCDCFDSPCIDPCWTPVETEKQKKLIKYFIAIEESAVKD